MKKIVLIICIGLNMLSLHAIAEGNKIVKWVDSNGVTHYGDKLPAQEAGRSNVEMRNNGVVVKQNMRADQKTQIVNQQKQQEKLVQEQADKVLLASYTNAEEIDLACERNLQMDHAALQSLIQHKENILVRTARNDKAAKQLKEKNKPLPAYMSEELKQYQAQIDTVDKQIEQRKLNMEMTRKRYADEKNRFIALKQVSSEQSSVATNEPAMAASLNMQ